jgi:hypothetical protein
MNKNLPLLKIWLARYLAIGLLMACSAGLRADPNPSFNLIGHIENFTLDDTANPLSAAKLTVRGIPITLPANLLIVMPGQYLTAHDIFRWNLSTNKYNNDARPNNSGLALRDTPPPAIPFEAEVIGNIVGGNYIAGAVHITQGALHVTVGTIQSTNPANSEFVVGPDGGGSGVKVRLNDPTGIYGVATTDLDQRFALDPGNSPVHAKTGFPVCLPRNDDPNKCPAGNRPGLGANHFRFTCAGTTGQGVPAAADAPSVSCNPTLPVPLAEGDYVTVVGMLAKDAAGNYFVSAHGLDAEIGIYTSPGVDPAYVYIEEALQGTKGEPFLNIPQEETTRFRIVGFTTDPTRNVEISLIDSGFPDSDPTAKTSISGSVGLFPSNGPQLGRFRNTWPAKDNARAVRRDVQATITSPNAVVALPNGLTAGRYTAPVAEYIYPEVTQFGARSSNAAKAFPVPVAFENFCFLRKPGATITTLDPHALEALTPFPNSGHPQSQTVGATGVRVCGD